MTLCTEYVFPRRADRLRAIMTTFRTRHVITAKELSEHFGVTQRTIYRDIDQLRLAGARIDGSSGVGFRLRPGGLRDFRAAGYVRIESLLSTPNPQPAHP